MISRAQGYAIHGIRGLVESFSSKGRIGAGTLTRAPDRDSRRLRTVAYRNLVRAVVAASEDSMKGKVVLVTGANGGLGTSVTKAFLDAGATVIGSSRKIQQADFESPNFTAIAADASTREGTKGLVDQVVAEFGKLNVLAHMVGGFAGGKSIADTDDAMFEQMMEMNLTSVFQMVRAAIPALRRSGSGRIIAIGSRAGSECRRVQRLEGCHGFIDQNGGSREQRRRRDRERDFARDNRYADEPQVHAECGFLEM